jgi:hypothetical protein
LQPVTCRGNATPIVVGAAAVQSALGRGSRTIRYLFPFSALNLWIKEQPLDAEGRMLVRYDDFMDALRRVVCAIPVDEVWYRAEYPALAPAFDQGQFRSCAHHFVAHGFFENLLPSDPVRSPEKAPPRYARIVESLHVVGGRCTLRVLISPIEIQSIIRQLLPAVPFDEQWYVQTYPSVAGAMQSSEGVSAQAEFIETGYFDVRMPFDMRIDEEWYLAHYPELRAGLEQGRWPSAQAHFYSNGYNEARRPGPSIEP